MNNRIAKKVALSLLILTIAIGLLVGCGSNKNQITDASKSSETSNKDIDGKSFYSGKIIIDAPQEIPNEAFIEALDVLREMEKYNDVEIILMEKDEEYDTTLPIKVAAGEQIDIMYNANPIQQQQWADVGVTIPMDEYVEAKGLDLEKTYGKYAQCAYNNGEIHGIPGGATFWGLFYNKKLFDDAGIPYPDEEVPMTWDEYRDIASKIANGNGGNKIYGALHLSWPMYWYGECIMALGGGEHFYTEDGMSNIEAPVFRKALEATCKMMHEDKSIPTYSDIKTTKLNGQAFFNGKYGMELCGSWFLNWVSDKEQFPRDWEVGMAPIPVDEGTTAKNWGVCGTYSMTPTTSDTELAFEVIVDLVRETTRLSSSEVYADQTIPANNLFKTICEKIEDEQITIDNIKKLYNAPIFVTEKITGPNCTRYEEILNEEVEKYFVKAQDIDTTIKNIKNRVDDILSKGK